MPRSSTTQTSLSSAFAPLSVSTSERWLEDSREFRGHRSWWAAHRPWFLPEGRGLPEEVWLKRHRGLTWMLWAQVPALFIFGVIRGYGVASSAIETSVLLVPGIVALMPRLSRNIRSASTALGLVIGASILVHFSGGLIEAHFQFFVVLAFLTLYQRWQPFLLALVYVVLEHGIVGALDPRAVYNEASAVAHPWTFAAIHGGFVLAASFGNILAWRLTEQQALQDGLTGLANRTYLLDWLATALQGRGRLSTAVVFIDLDDFKDTNDGFGHEVGDLLLQAICHRLERQIRDGDLLARIGGDEFAVVLVALGSRESGITAASRILEVFKEPFRVLEMNLSVAASIGISFGADGDCTPSELVRNADLAMYEAKRAGGERVREFEPVLHALALQRTELAAELRSALSENQFAVHYQPIFSIGSGALTGVEALVRWTHPTRGVIPPVEFIPAAEQSGLIVPLGAWVLRSACSQAARWQALRPDGRPLKISVNLSPRQLAEPSLVATVVGALSDSGLEPSSLCLEITESAFIRDFETALSTLNALKTIGVVLALDDFGTGYSSLSYLQRLPIDNVKIDRSFIIGLDTDGHDTRIVRAIIDLARAMGMVVTAEGVETEKQLDRLNALHIDLGQGFLLGRPQSPEALSSLIVNPTPPLWHSTTGLHEISVALRSGEIETAM